MWVLACTREVMRAPVPCVSACDKHSRPDSWSTGSIQDVPGAAEAARQAAVGGAAPRGRPVRPHPRRGGGGARPRPAGRLLPRRPERAERAGTLAEAAAGGGRAEGGPSEADPRRHVVHNDGTCWTWMCGSVFFFGCG